MRVPEDSLERQGWRSALGNYNQLPLDAALSRQRSRVRASSPPFLLKELPDVTPETKRKDAGLGVLAMVEAKAMLYVVCSSSLRRVQK